MRGMGMYGLVRWSPWRGRWVHPVLLHQLPLGVEASTVQKFTRAARCWAGRCGTVSAFPHPPTLVYYVNR